MKITHTKPKTNPQRLITVTKGFLLIFLIIDIRNCFIFSSITTINLSIPLRFSRVNCCSSFYLLNPTSGRLYTFSLCVACINNPSFEGRHNASFIGCYISMCQNDAIVLCIRYTAIYFLKYFKLVYIFYS